ncbi:hypothetical protein [Sphingobium sp. BS19]|uniref:hypothetical protein n=1 Tax=Sphingobium sp. BS19 TaxID=3018973 RepID=UPI0022EE61DD|nr:hypothetical protein [Sphingobium sp. BS19]GLI99121.1 hypothetical protein Sbs19_29390 [Sphingobium sp. BS19]
MRSFLAGAICIALAGCNSAARQAERAYEIVNESGTDEERCAEAGKVAQTYLDAGDKAQYERWDMVRDTHCLTVSTKRAIQ